jgi:hypothetical protein
MVSGRKPAEDLKEKIDFGRSPDPDPSRFPVPFKNPSGSHKSTGIHQTNRINRTDIFACPAFDTLFRKDHPYPFFVLSKNLSGAGIDTFATVRAMVNINSGYHNRKKSIRYKEWKIR